MSFSQYERLSLILLLQIIEHLGVQNASGYGRYREALEQGFQLHYMPEGWMIGDEEVTTEECQEVLDILDMYRAIHGAMAGLPAQAQKAISAVGPSEFLGFDGNNETKQMSYTRYLVDRLGRYQELRYGKKAADFNSHAPVLDIYRAMVEVWDRECRRSRQPDENGLRLILGARPANRRG